MIEKTRRSSIYTSLYGFARQHRAVLGLLAVILLVWSGVGGVYYIQATNKIAANEAVSAEKAKKGEGQLEEIRQKVQAEKALEEQKAKELAEAEVAQKAADEANSQPPSNQSGTTQPEGCNMASLHTNPATIDVLVNKKHCLRPLTFTPPDLVSSNGATLSAKAMGDFNRMFADAAAAGQPFTVSSSYRSYTNQVSTYNYWVSMNGQQGADTVSARPGFSEHQTGLAVDVGANGCNLNCFVNTTQYQWFQANAANYGFIQRYYQGYEAVTGYASEEWHYRYVGVPVAQDMKAKGIRTLEQYWGLEGGNYR